MTTIGERNEALWQDYQRLRPEHATDAAVFENISIRTGIPVHSLRRIIGVMKKLTAPAPRIVPPVDVVPLGHAVKGVSSLVDADGTLVMQWVKTNAEQQSWREIIDAVLASIPKLITPRPAVLRKVSAGNDLLALYPLADLHIGLYASMLDAAVDWGLDDTVALMKATIDDLIARTPAAATAVVACIGDFTHTDNMVNRTPNSGAALDADGRFIEIAQAAMTLAVYAIDRVAQRHTHVEVIWQSGNHDEGTALVLQAALAMLYRNDARVHVHQSGSRTHCIQHGQVALGFTHGDTIKAKNLPLIMATDYPDIWAATRFRVWHTGHIHHKTVEEFIGCMVESHQSPAPRDAWHERQGYRSLHSMCSIAYDLRGEYARHTLQIRHGVTGRTAAAVGASAAA